MAMAGFVCSLSAALVTVLLILIMTVPSLVSNPDEAIGLLLLAGAILWVTGLVLSLRARRRAVRRRRLARTARVVSVITATLFLAGLVIWLVFVVEWLVTDLFVVGTAIGSGADTVLVDYRMEG